MNTQERAIETPSGSLMRDAEWFKEQRRLQRLAALKAIAGIWKDRDDIPKDGVEFQRALRAEWGTAITAWTVRETRVGPI